MSESLNDLDFLGRKRSETKSRSQLHDGQTHQREAPQSFLGLSLTQNIAIITHPPVNAETPAASLLTLQEKSIGLYPGVAPHSMKNHQHRQAKAPNATAIHSRGKWHAKTTPFTVFCLIKMFTTDNYKQKKLLLLSVIILLCRISGSYRQSKSTDHVLTG